MLNLMFHGVFANRWLHFFAKLTIFYLWSESQPLNIVYLYRFYSIKKTSESKVKLSHVPLSTGIFGYTKNTSNKHLNTETLS